MHARPDGNAWVSVLSISELPTAAALKTTAAASSQSVVSTQTALIVGLPLFGLGVLAGLSFGNRYRDWRFKENPAARDVL